MRFTVVVASNRNDRLVLSSYGSGRANKRRYYYCDFLALAYQRLLYILAKYPPPTELTDEEVKHYVKLLSEKERYGFGQ